MHKNSKLTDEQVIEIFNFAHRSDMKQVEIAKKYGITQGHVQAIKNCMTRKHVTRWARLQLLGI